MTMASPCFSCPPPPPFPLATFPLSLQSTTEYRDGGTESRIALRVQKCGKDRSEKFAFATSKPRERDAWHAALRLSAQMVAQPDEARHAATRRVATARGVLQRHVATQGRRGRWRR